MPYIVTTKRKRHAEFNVVAASEGREAWSDQSELLSRRAVATLDEAQTLIRGATARLGVAEVAESGGTVGPLPDGTVIEVEQTTWLIMLQEVGEPWGTETYRAVLAGDREAQQRIFDAYNKETA